MKTFVVFCHLLYFIISFHFNEALPLLNIFQRPRPSIFRDQMARYPEPNPYNGVAGPRLWAGQQNPNLPLPGTIVGYGNSRLGFGLNHHPHDSLYNTGLTPQQISPAAALGTNGIVNGNGIIGSGIIGSPLGVSAGGIRNLFGLNTGMLGNNRIDGSDFVGNYHNERCTEYSAEFAGLLAADQSQYNADESSLLFQGLNK